ncbi:TonB-dependent receptor plug domain-containing protein [Roseateles depolymerans]|uniref:TonB-dependent receptor n=1 Tax=Roseateles depolymerans TaxID=76731 RepID=A0A0U3NL00_9BURK|nr:TonB-dependent receptor [Roseateles depolymerans]ALV09072.1 TonB-dependent receptor [Roseateles depolymerans]REG13827.1 iron complex outermembrane receptor protein [Roseateles depolymerans]
MFKRNARSTAALALIGVLGAGAALAQEASTDKLERVEVTGSRIRQIDIETAQPVQKISQAEIQKSGLVTVGDILNQLSSAGSPDFSKGSVLTSNREQGGQYINLRNLGSERLLVLVNGKRWTTSVAGFTDLSTIPSALIDHIDVLKDGASSTYGSDAIAGVVNIILKKTLEGGQFSAYYGENSKGDGQTQDFSFAFGANSDKASIMFGASYSKQDTVWARTRDITSSTYGPGNEAAGFGTGPWGRIRQVSASGGATGFNKYLNHTGGPLGDGVGQASNVAANYHDYKGIPEDTFNSTSQMMFQSPTELKSLFVKGSIDVAPDVRFVTTAMYADRVSTRQIAGYPLNSTSQAAYPVYIDKDSYYNPYGNQAVGAGNGQDLFFYRRTIEVPRVTRNNNKATHLDAGFEGDLTILGKPWSWDAGVNFSQSGGTVLSTGNINLLNLKKALGPSFMNASGVVQCGTAANPIALTSCTPFDILGGPSASNQAALNYIMSTGQATYGSTVKSATVNLSGEVFQLPAGAVGVAGGLEHRSLSGYDRPGQFEQSGYSTDLAGNATVGRYNVNEAYLELNVPVLKNVVGAELLSFNAATRYSDYSSFGNTTNSKVSFMWKPIKDVLTRGTWAQGFRAPTLADSFGGGSQSFDSYLDPCDTKLGSAATTPSTQANCAAAGVPANFRQVNQAGTPVTAATQGIVAFNTGAGNSFLKPETATTKTLGVVYSPSQIKGLTAGLDWYRIQVKNRITAISATYVLNQCYVQGVQSFCSSLKRDPVTGMITSLSRGNANLGQLETEGLDLDVSYQFPSTSYGQFAVRTNTSYVDKYEIKSTDTSDPINYAGAYPYYRVKSNISLDWKLNVWSATFSTRYYSKTKVDCAFTCSNPDEPLLGDPTAGFDRKGAVMYHDLSVGYKTPWKGQILVGANNVFNKKPRLNIDANSGYGGNSSSSSVDPDLPIDRFFWVRYNQTF